MRRLPLEACRLPPRSRAKYRLRGLLRPHQFLAEGGVSARSGKSSPTPSGVAPPNSPAPPAGRRGGWAPHRSSRNRRQLRTPRQRTRRKSHRGPVSLPWGIATPSPIPVLCRASRSVDQHGLSSCSGIETGTSPPRAKRVISCEHVRPWSRDSSSTDHGVLEPEYP